MKQTDLAPGIKSERFSGKEQIEVPAVQSRSFVGGFPFVLLDFKQEEGKKEYPSAVSIL